MSTAPMPYECARAQLLQTLGDLTIAEGLTTSPDAIAQRRITVNGVVYWAMDTTNP